MRLVYWFFFFQIEKVSLQRSSAVRPNSLDLDNALTLDMDCVFQELDDNNSNNNNVIPTNSGTRNSRKKRKRAAIKKFSGKLFSS